MKTVGLVMFFIGVVPAAAARVTLTVNYFSDPCRCCTSASAPPYDATYALESMHSSGT